MASELKPIRIQMSGRVSIGLQPIQHPNRPALRTLMDRSADFSAAFAHHAVSLEDHTAAKGARPAELGQIVMPVRSR